jgi:hypothetical protein
MPPPVDPPPVNPVTYTDLKSGVQYTRPNYTVPISQKSVSSANIHDGSTFFSSGNDNFYIQINGQQYRWNTQNRELTII